MTPSTVTALISKLRQQVGDIVQPADGSCEVAGVLPRVLVEPRTVEDVAAVVSFANAEGLKVLLRGGATQQSMGFPPTGGDVLLSTRALDQVVDYTAHDQTITVQAGIRVDRLQEALAPAGQWLALDPPLGDGATAGGVLSTNVSGPRRLRYGGVRDQLLGVRVVLADGTIARGGGKVVKNVAGYDLPKLFTGALGTLGVVVEASFRVYPRLPISRTVLITACALEPVCALALSILGHPLTPTSLDVFARQHDAELNYSLAVHFESHVQAAIEEQASMCVALAQDNGLTGRAVGGDEERTVWNGDALSPSPLRDGELTAFVKASLLPSDVAHWLALAESVGERGEIGLRWRAHAGHGLIDAQITGELDAVVAALRELREAARERRGTLIVSSAPPQLADHFDVWGPSPALDLMRSVKARFDPQSTLNPGRFIGRL